MSRKACLSFSYPRLDRLFLMLRLDSWQHRKMQREDRALRWFTGHANPAAHRFHHALHQIKPQAHSANLSLARVLPPKERLEHVGKVRSGDAHSLVLHADTHFGRNSPAE